MSPASDVIANPASYLNPLTDPKPDQSDINELLHMHLADDDIAALALKVKGISKKAVIENVRAVVLDCTLHDSISEVNTLTLRIHDPDWELLNSGVLDHTIDINPGNIAHRWYRLDAVDVSDDDITLTFIVRNAAYLQLHKRPYKISRNKVTRAEFILTLLHHVKVTKIPFFCPQLHKIQPKAKEAPGGDTADSSSSQRNGKRQSGLSLKDNLTVKGSPADSHQIGVIEDVLRAGSKKHATPRMLVGAIMTIIVETEAGKIVNNPKYVGVFQQDPAYWAATGDPYKDAVGANGKKGFFDDWIPLAKANPGGDLGKLVMKSQGAGDQQYWMKADRWRPEAEKAVRAFLGRDVNFDAEVSGDAPDQFRQKFEFMVGPDDGPNNENYLAAIYRLADEVHWSAYWVRDVLHYQSQEDLFKSKARARIRRYDEGVESVQFGMDRSKKINQLTIQVRMVKWFAPIGTVIVFDEGGPAKGRWLVTDIERSMFNQLGTITLAKPITEKKEPLKQLSSRSKDATSSDGAPVDPGDIEGTPKDIIDNVIIPQAQSFGKFMSGGGYGPLTPSNVLKANKSHSPKTTSGNTSDHYGWINGGLITYAVDMSTDWTDHPNAASAPDEMVQMAKWLKDNFNLPNWQGGCFSSYSKDGRYRFQICYLTPTGGDHFNHIHFGVKDNKPQTQRTTAQDRKQSGN